jgi:flagellar motor switch protein FliM
MNRTLSQEEIDAILLTASSAPTEPRVEGERKSTAVGYNFRRPDRVTKDQIRSLHFLHDRFARNVSTSLSAYMRVVTEVSILSVEQFTYSEFLMSLYDPTAFYAVSMRPLEGVAALELNPSVAFCMIDRMLGGSGRSVMTNRALTEIEQNVTDSVVKVILENLTDAWRGVVDVQFRITARETRPQMLQVAAPNEVVLLLGFEIKIGATTGVLNLCIPASSIEAVSGSFNRSWQRTRRDLTPAEHDALHDTLGRVKLSLEAVVHTSMAAGDFVNLKVGDVIGLDHRLDQPLDVHVNGRPKFVGQPIVSSGRARIRIDDVVRASATHAA